MAEHYWHRAQRARISRRRLLQGTGAAMAAGLVAYGSGGLGGIGRARATSDPRYGGRYKIGTAIKVDTLDPHTGIAGSVPYFPRVYNTLVAQSATNPQFVVFDLASSFEQPDETTWIFHIRPRVGIAPNQLDVPERDMDASDAYESYERIKGLDQASAAVLVNEWFEQHQASADGETYTIWTPSPYAWFLLNIGRPFNTIPPRELIQNLPERMRTAAVGGGPFSVQPGGYQAGDFLALDRNPSYYRRDPTNGSARLPYIDGIDVRFIQDRSALRTAFLSQQTYQYSSESTQESDEILNQYDGVYEGSVEPVFTFISFVMNVKRPPWNDARVRKAAMYALNRQHYIDIIYRGDARANGLVHWPTGAYALPDDELEELQPFDPERSRALLRDAGFELPLRIRVMYPANTSIEQHNSHLPIFLEQMAAAGFEVEQGAQDFLTWLTNYTDKDYDASLALNQIYETPEIPLDFHHSAGPAGDHIYSNGLQDPAIDAAIEAAKAITDPQDLVAAVHEVQRQIYEAGPAFLPLVSPFSRSLYWNFVKNLPEGLGQAGLYLNDWWLGPEVGAAFGDVDCSGDVDSRDAALVLQRSAGLTPTLPCGTSADVNDDSRIDSRDALLILQHDAGLLTEL